MSAGAILVPPLAVVDSMIVSCTVAEDDYPEYNAATTYAVGARVIVAAVHKVYQSAVAGNVGNNPTATSSADKWKLVGSTNRYKCLNYLSLSSKTTKVGGFSYRIKPGQVVNAFFMDAATADSVRVRMIDPVAGTVYDSGAVSMLGTLRRSSWYNFYFSRRRRRTQLLLLDLPSYYGADVLIDVVATGEASAGLLMLGYQMELGYGVKLGATAGITDYSKDIVNEFGDAVFTKLAYADRASLDLVIKNDQVDEVRETLADYRATPCLYIGYSGYSSTVVFGRYSDFEILLVYNTESDCSLNLKGLPR